jgi:hypothetical protein
MEWIAFAKSVSVVACRGDYERRREKVVAAGYHAKKRELFSETLYGRKSDCRDGHFAGK